MVHAAISQVAAEPYILAASLCLPCEEPSNGLCSPNSASIKSWMDCNESLHAHIRAFYALFLRVEEKEEKGSWKAPVKKLLNTLIFIILLTVNVFVLFVQGEKPSSPINKTTFWKCDGKPAVAGTAEFRFCAILQGAAIRRYVIWLICYPRRCFLLDKKILPTHM